MRNLRLFFKNMPFTMFTVLIMLSIVLSAVTLQAFYNENKSGSPTETNDFITYALSYNGQGNVNFSKKEIRIETISASQPRVLVYMSSSTFKWNFSVTALEAKGDSHPIAFSVNWKYGEILIGEFLVWAHTTYGWHYNYRNNSTWVATDISLDSSLKVGARYDVEIQWTKQSANVNVHLSIENSTWHKELTLDIPIPPKTRVDYANLYVESWANKDAYALTDFYSGQFVSYNMEKYSQPTYLGLSFLLLSSTTLCAIAVLVLLEKIKHFSFDIKTFFHRIATVFCQIDIKKPFSGMFSNVKRYQICLLLLILFGGLRLFLAANTTGHLFDIQTLKTWFHVIQSKGLFAIYSFTDILPPYLGLRPVYPYPPMIAYQLFLLQIFPTNIVQENPAFFLRLPPIVADLLLGLIVFVIVRKKEGNNVALAALFLSLLNMANSSIWGQYDSVVSLFMVLSVWLVATKRTKFGWAFAALAISTKQTALILLPGLLILTVKQKRWSELFYGVLIFAATTFFIWYPFMLNGFSFDSAGAVSGLSVNTHALGLDPISPEGGGGTSIWAFNIWPLITLVLNNQPPSMGIVGAVKDTLPNQLLTLSYFQFGLLIFALAYLLIITKLWKTSTTQGVMFQFSLLLLTFYMLPTRVHDRFLIYALCFLPLTYIKQRKIIVSYLILLSTYWLSLEYGLLGGPWRNNLGELSPLINTIFSEYGLLFIILMNIIVFVWLLFFNFNKSFSAKKAIAMFERKRLTKYSFMLNFFTKSLRAIGWRDVPRFFRAWAVFLLHWRRTINGFDRIKAYFYRKKGLEIGGPSDIFSPRSILPIYGFAENIDNCNYATETVWEDNLRKGLTFHYRKNRLGYQFICEATNLEDIKSETYDFVISSHVLEHIANPIKAFFEWKRVTKNGGVLLLVVSHKQGTFDHKRPITQLDHLIQDYHNKKDEADLSHLPEILHLHDLQLDLEVDTQEAFYARSKDNFRYRCLHHHVFITEEIIRLIDFVDLRIVFVESLLPWHIIICGQKMTAMNENQLMEIHNRNIKLLDKNASWRRSSPFYLDK